jgi:spermidine synthase
MYYTEDGPFGQALAARTGPLRRDHIAVIGLGAGGTSVYRRPGEDWTYYEIDPLVRHIATATPYFTFLRDCAPDARIELGDARLTLRATAQQSFDVLVLDAFSSDAIPVHLLTREAMALYLGKLRPGGIVLMHVSNRYLDLAPILARIAEELGLHLRMQQFRVKNANVTFSDWVVLARSEADLGSLAGDPRWRRLDPGSAPLWTDSFSNILDVLKR